MKTSDFIASISLANSFFKELKIINYYKRPHSLTASDEFLKTSKSPQYSYDSVYLCGLQNNDFNIILFDYSYLQFTLETESCRFAYYPNPFSADIVKFKDYEKKLLDGVISYEEYSELLSEVPSNLDKPFLRYEYDEKRYNHMEHPASHLHIGCHEDRWAVKFIFSPFIFSLMIAKLYYKDFWRASGAQVIDIEGYHNKFDKILKNEKQKCVSVSDLFFSALESKSIHIF